MNLSAESGTNRNAPVHVVAGGRVGDAWPTGSVSAAASYVALRVIRGNISCVEIADSARKHGITGRDILHVIGLPLRQIQDGNVDRVLVIGADTHGRLLEVVVLDPESDEPVVIHAMILRRSFLRYL
jgi:hypothetical protein